MNATKTKAQEIGARIGQAIARDVLAEDMPREWTGLDAQDGDQFTAAGIEPETAEWSEAESAARTAYEQAIDGHDLVCGNQVQRDKSGVGHCWVDICATDIPAGDREEMEGEMIDGGKEECDDFLASSGQHYRW